MNSRNRLSLSTKSILQLSLLSTVVFNTSVQADSQPSVKAPIDWHGEVHLVANHGTVTNEKGDQSQQANIPIFALGFDRKLPNNLLLVVQATLNNSNTDNGSLALQQLYITGQPDVVTETVKNHLKDHVSADKLKMAVGLMPVPVGILNQHKSVFESYGVNKSVIEQRLLLDEWSEMGVKADYQLTPALNIQYMLQTGLLSEDPSENRNAEPYNLTKAKQSGSQAANFSMAHTASLSYTGSPHLLASAYMNYQPDLDQSATNNYADAAMMIGGHVMFQLNDSVELTALYTRWTLDGSSAKQAKRNQQKGGYFEANYQTDPKYGFFARIAQWQETQGETGLQTLIGANYWLDKTAVIKSDIQMQNKAAGNLSGFNIGMAITF